MVDLRDRYIITSNRESGFGRYDIMMEPVDKEKNDGIIIEFKVLNKRREKNLQETLESALKQIEEKNYAQNLIDRGVKPDRIRKYGFAFEGKTVEIECR
jgi:predicted Zn-ribbon and HTH transcriptional regulator